MLEKLKSFIADDGFYTAALLIMVAFASFGLGRQSVVESDNTKTISNEATVVLTAPSPKATVPQALTPTPLPGALTDPGVEGETTVSGEVVASKSGTKYHLPTCSGAKSIKPENLITFATRAEAEAAGYTPAANCKGLQ